MELVELKEIFYIKKSQDIVASEVEAFFRGLPLVSSTEKNNGIIKRIRPDAELALFPAGAMTVARNGSVLACFIQKEAFYTTCDVRVILPKGDMLDKEKLFYKLAIEANKYRYSYGKKAGSGRLASLKIPSQVPEWVYSYDIKKAKERFLKAVNRFCDRFNRENEPRCAFKGGRLDELFEIHNGKAVVISETEECADGIPLISASGVNNGIVKRIMFDEALPLFPAGSLTVACDGSVLSCFIQREEFYTTRNSLRILFPKISMSNREKFFYKTAIEANKYRYSFGRAAMNTLPSLKLPPVPEWVYNYDINALRRKILTETEIFAN